MLHGNSQTLPHNIARERPFSLGKHTSSRLIRHARSNTLVKTIHLPFDLVIGVLQVHIRENYSSKGGIGTV